MRVLHVYSGNLSGGIETLLGGLHGVRKDAHLTASAKASASPPELASAGDERKRKADTTHDATMHDRAADDAEVVHEFALCFEGRLSRQLRDRQAAVHLLGDVRVSRPHTVRRARGTLAALLARGDFDRVICHAPWAQAIFGGVVRRTGVPLVFWAHDAMTGRHWTERLARRNHPDLVICNSRYTASTLDTLYQGTSEAVIYAPVAQERTIAPSERAAIRASLQTRPDAVVIAQASRIEAWKGLDVLIAALGELRSVPGWVCWQIGGPQRPSEQALLDALRRQAEECRVADRVRWAGERCDVPHLLAASDIHCQPNRTPEPFGVVLVEALAAGLPVVTSRLGGACEVVDEHCGVLIPPGDPAAVAAALHDLIVNPLRRGAMAAAAPQRARLLCDPARQSARLVDALMRMAIAKVA